MGKSEMMNLVLHRAGKEQLVQALGRDWGLKAVPKAVVEERLRSLRKMRAEEVAELFARTFVALDERAVATLLLRAWRESLAQEVAVEAPRPMSARRMVVRARR